MSNYQEPVCFRCGHKLIQTGNDEWGDEPDCGNRYYYTCPNCGDEYEQCEVSEADKANYDYWKYREASETNAAYEKTERTDCV